MPDKPELRRSKVAIHADATRCRILEIGALDNPTYPRPEYDVKFVDYASTDDLAKKGESNPRYRRESIVEVDFVCPTPDYTKTIHEQFDLIVANHVIEHVPDTIRWLQELHTLLAPEGHLFLSVPDKRYTFDIVRPETTFVDLLRNYDDEVRKPTFYQILEHFYFHKSVSIRDVYAGRHHDKLSVMRYPTERAVQVARKHAEEPYADVHCHVFTCESFEGVLRPLIELGKVPFDLVSVGETVPLTNEFHVMLQRRRATTP